MRSRMKKLLRVSLVFILTVQILLLPAELFAFRPMPGKEKVIIWDDHSKYSGKPKVRGRYVDVRYVSESGWRMCESGELIAVSDRFIYVQGYGDMDKVLIDRVYKVEVDIHNVTAWQILGGTFGGMLISPFMTGIVSVFLIPLWFITGTVASVFTAANNDQDFKEDQIKELRKYARYPQGLPFIHHIEGSDH